MSKPPKRLVSPYVRINDVEAKLRAEARKVGALKNQLRKLREELELMPKGYGDL